MRLPVLSCTSCHFRQSRKLHSRFGVIVEGFGVSTMTRNEKQKRVNLQKLHWVPIPVPGVQKQGDAVPDLSDLDEGPRSQWGHCCVRTYHRLAQAEGCFGDPC